MADIEHRIDRAVRRLYAANPANDWQAVAIIESTVGDVGMVKVLRAQQLLQTPISFGEDTPQLKLSEKGVARAASATIKGRWSTKALAVSGAVGAAIGAIGASLVKVLLGS